MASENIVAALDIGTTKITVLVAEMDENDGIYVIGHGISNAEGMRRGVVVDMEKAVRSIGKAVEDAQMVSGTEIDAVTVSIAGEHIRSINSHGVIQVSHSDNEITASDVKRAIEAARTVAIPVDREIIHVIPQNFTVDAQSEIRDPIGMTGVRLELEAHIVTASISTAKNVYRAMERCNLEINHMVLEALALSQVTLNDNDMENGIIIVDIGGDLTNLSMFYEGAVRHTAVVTLGSRNVTNDIAIGLRTPLSKAEDLKIAHGSALINQVDPEEMIMVTSADGRSSREISRNVLASIIEPRMEEILSLVLKEIRQANIKDMLTGGMILTGGGALLPGTVQLAENIFDMPVRCGTINEIEHVPDEINDLRYFTALGLLVYGFSNDPDGTGRRMKVKGMLKKFENWISKQF